jgi:hypothetical protein
MLPPPPLKGRLKKTRAVHTQNKRLSLFTFHSLSVDLAFSFLPDYFEFYV